MTKYYRQQGKYSYTREVGGLRTVDGTLDAALVEGELLAIDTAPNEAFPFPESILQRGKYYTIGSGTFNQDFMTEQGYAAVEETLSMLWRVGTWLFLALGACDTAGTASSATTVHIDSIAGKVLTCSSDGEGAVFTWTTNEWAGCMLEVTSGDMSGYKYHIVSNAASTLTLDKTPAANLDEDVCKIMEPQFTHTITELNAAELPSFALHLEQENTADAESIRKDLLGCIVTKLTLNMDKLGDATIDVDFVGCKSVAGSDLAAPTLPTQVGETAFTAYTRHEVWKWSDVDSATFVFQYNSADILANNQDDIDNIKVEINNNAGIEHVIGDLYPKRKHRGEREYTINMRVFPDNDTLYTLRNTAWADYVAGAISLTIRLQKSGTYKYVEIVFTNLYVDQYPNEFPPSADDSTIGVDLVLMNGPGCTCSCTIVDNLGIAYYEGTAL